MPQDPQQKPIVISSQAGPQREFLSTLADVAIFGGAAGGGKSYALLLEPVRHYNNPKFGGVIFRRNTTQVRNEGGLWDESSTLYPLLGAKPREIALEWTFPSGARMKFAHLEYEKTVLEWQGAQIAYIGFDELTHFTENQFFYMLSRNRSTSGIRGYVRATCNPDADSWVRKLLDWWIGPDGFPIKARSGVLRWFIRHDDEIVWGNTREELLEKHGGHQQPKSVTFISALLQDNKILMEKDPSYLSNLMALNRVERERLLGGNWNVRASAGNYFKREYFTVVEHISNTTVTQQIRFWDRAATKPNESNRDPDWTVGVKLGKLATGAWIVLNVVRIRDTPMKVEELVMNTARLDGWECTVGLEQDPGSAGVSDIDNMVRKLAGYIVKVFKPTKDKVTRASPVSAQCERGNVFLMKGPWNEPFLHCLENFPPEGSTGHDDDVDAFSGAFNALMHGYSICDVL